MPYSEFKLRDVIDLFQLTVVEQVDVFASVPPVAALSIGLLPLLEEFVPLAVAINTEKGRSELIVINILAEVRRQLPGRVSVFSGINLSVSPEDDLSGYCDFLLSLSPQQMLVQAPIVALVEAKNDNLPAGWGQCCAEMVAAQRFNERRGNTIPKIYGAVTSGTAWMFGGLIGQEVQIDLTQYSIEEPERIVGILTSMVQQTV
jgi:hypothetical protein